MRQTHVRRHPLSRPIRVTCDEVVETLEADIGVAVGDGEDG
jgi:hypothetical protein